MTLKNIPQAERLLSGTLTSYLSDVATTCVMSDPPSKFPTYIDLEPDSTTKKELIRAVAVSGSTVTIERSVNGVVTDHAANATYKQKITSRHWDAVSDALEKGYLMEDALRALIRVSDTQFTITGYGASDDLTTKYAVGRYLRSNSSNSYVTQVTSSSYAAGTNKTTVNVADTLPTPLSTIEMAIGAEGGFAHLKVKATAAEVATGTDDTKIVTPKAIKDAGIVVTPVKASGAEVTTGTDDAKFATPKALADAGVNTRLKTKIKQISRDLSATGGDVAYTGIGFTPSAMIAMAGLGGTGATWGMVDSAKGHLTMLKSTNATDNFATNTGAVGASLIIYDTSAGNYQTAVVKTFDADGFTLTWAKTGSPTGTLYVSILCFA
jgi:hypothetical protein